MEGVQNALEPKVSQAQIKKLIGETTEKMEEKQACGCTKTRKKWCNGGVSVKKRETQCAKNCAEQRRKKFWRSAKWRKEKYMQGKR